MSEVGQEEFDAKAENARLHMVLDREYALSIFGSTISKSTVRSHHSNSSSEQYKYHSKKSRVCCTVCCTVCSDRRLK